MAKKEKKIRMTPVRPDSVNFDRLWAPSQQDRDLQEAHSRVRELAYNRLGADTTAAGATYNYRETPTGRVLDYTGPTRPDWKGPPKDTTPATPAPAQGKPRAVIPPTVDYPEESTAPPPQVTPAEPAPQGPSEPVLPLSPLTRAPERAAPGQPGTISEAGKYTIIEPRHFDSIMASHPSFASWSPTMKARIREQMTALIAEGWNQNAAQSVADIGRGVPSESVGADGKKVILNIRPTGATMGQYTADSFLTSAINRYNRMQRTEGEEGKLKPTYHQQGGAVGEIGVEVSAKKPATRAEQEAARADEQARRRAAVAPPVLDIPANADTGTRSRITYANTLRAEAHDGYKKGWKPTMGRYSAKYFQEAERANAEARDAAAYIRTQVRDWNSKNPNHKMDPDVMVRLFIAESNLNPRAVNKSSGAAGIAQMMPAFLRDIREKLKRDIDPYNMQQALWGAINLTGHYMKTYNLSQEAAVIGYHDGFPVTNRMRQPNGWYGVRTATQEGSEEFYRVYLGDPAAIRRLNEHGVHLNGQLNAASSGAAEMVQDAGEGQSTGAQMPPETSEAPPTQAPAGAAAGSPSLQDIYDRQRQATAGAYDELEAMADQLFKANPEMEKRLRAMIDKQNAEPLPAGPNPWAAAVMGFLNPQVGQQYVTGKNAELQQAQREKKAKISQYEETILENRLKEEIARRDWTSALKTKKLLDLAAINTEQAKAEATMLEKEAQRTATRENLRERLRSQEQQVLTRARAALQTAGVQVDAKAMEQLVAIYRATASQDEYGASSWANDPAGLAQYVAQQYAAMLSAAGGAAQPGAPQQGQPQPQAEQGQPQQEDKRGRLMGVFSQGPRQGAN